MTFEEARIDFLYRRKIGEDPLMVNSNLMPGPAHKYCTAFKVVPRLVFQARCKEIGHEAARLEVG